MSVAKDQTKGEPDAPYGTKKKAAHKMTMLFIDI